MIDNKKMSELLTSLLEEVPENRLPLPDEISYYKLEKERKLFLDYDIDEPIMVLERMLFRWNMEDRGIPREERKPIWIYIQSPGGYTYYMWPLIDLITASVTPVYTVNIGNCMSAASLIFMAGHKRFMFPRAKVMIHQGSGKIEGDAQKVADQAASYKEELKQMRDYILSRTSIPVSMLNKKKNNDWELDAQYCLDNGVCDVVIHSIEEVL